jgi:hypothetical protein
VTAVECLVLFTFLGRHARHLLWSVNWRDLHFVSLRLLQQLSVGSSDFPCSPASQPPPPGSNLPIGERKHHLCQQMRKKRTKTKQGNLDVEVVAAACWISMSRTVPKREVRGSRGSAVPNSLMTSPAHALSGIPTTTRASKVMSTFFNRCN